MPTKANIIRSATTADCDLNRNQYEVTFEMLKKADPEEILLVSFPHLKTVSLHEFRANNSSMTRLPREY